MAEPPSLTLAIFDFDGTLCRLATDYAALRAELARLAVEAGIEPGERLLELLQQLEADPAVGSRATETVIAAERAGLTGARALERGVSLYESFSRNGAHVAIASHNSAEVIEAFLATHILPHPDEIFDRRRLGEAKERAEALVELARALAPERIVVVGDSESDRLLARKLEAIFIAAE
jgi:phosphoglycolate phosphatase-like HAD superfamily hydrolase